MSVKWYRAVLLVCAVTLCGCEAKGGLSARGDADARAVEPADPLLARAESLDVAGESPAALELARQTLSASARRFGPESPQAAAAMTVVARLVHAQGDFAEARRLDETALAVRRHVFGEQHLLVAQSMLQLASDVKNSGGPLTEALKLCRQSLLLRRELLRPGSREIGESLMGLANMHRAMNRPDSAKTAFVEALVLRRELNPPDPDAVAATLTALSLVYTQASDWPAAEPLLREAVMLRRALPRPRAGGLEMSLSTYGMTLRNLGRAASAESVLTECAALREDLRRAATSGRGRAAMFDLSIYWQLAAAQLEQDHGAAAWVSVERGMSRTLIESLHDRGVIDTLGMWRHALGRVQERLAPDAAIIGWLELKRGAGREGYPMWAYAIRDHGPVRWHRIDGKGGDMWHGSSDVLYGYKAELRAAAGWPLRLADTSEVARLGRAIYALRIAPLEPDLNGVRRLLVVSPDIMRGIPLESLADTSGRWMGDRFEITYTPSALLGSMRSGSGARERAPRAWRALLVGDPAYAATGGAASGAANYPATGGAIASATAAPAAWPPLGATRREIETVAALLPGATVLLGRDASEAKLHALAASGALGRYDLIHFATHAAIDERSPGSSALVLSESPGPGRPSAGPDGSAAKAGPMTPDGLVTVDEIATQWRLNARLVSLAACSSVLGPVSHVEGYIGFEQAMLGAGARSLLVSLWHVDDQATGLLMRRFYANLLAAPAGGSPAGSRRRSGSTPHATPPARATMAAALREAQRWLRTFPGPAGDHPYAHPVYWAGIVLVGDPE